MLFLFTHGVAQYEAEARNKQVAITRTVFTCAGHPEQNVTLRHYLTYGWPVYEISVDNSEGMLNITLSDGNGSFWHEFYSFSEIECMFTGEGEEDDESVDQIKDSDEYRMPNYKWDSKYVEKFLKHNESVCCGNDPVNHPNHYKTSSGLEAIDVIDAFTEDLKGYESVYTSQVLKYTLRWKHKNGLEDLKKAEWYLNRLIKKLERRNDNEEVCAVE